LDQKGAHTGPPKRFRKEGDLPRTSALQKIQGKPRKREKKSGATRRKKSRIRRGERSRGGKKKVDEQKLGPRNHLVTGVKKKKKPERRNVRMRENLQKPRRVVRSYEISAKKNCMGRSAEGTGIEGCSTAASKGPIKE